MSNTILIAKKEFQELINSPAILFIMIVYVVLALCSFFEFYRLININDNYEFWMNSSRLSNILVSYGSLIAIVIGFTSITSEINSYALNTIIGKPVYRDTVINGKLIGIACFITCLYIFTIIIVLILDVLFIHGFTNDIGLFFSSLPAVLLVSLLCSIFYLALTMFLSIAIRNQILALMTSFLVWIFLTTILPNFVFGYPIANILDLFVGDLLHTNNGDIGNFIAGLSPSIMQFIIFKKFMDLSVLFNIHGYELFKLALYDFVTVILCYMGFIRRDVQ